MTKKINKPIHLQIILSAEKAMAFFEKWILLVLLGAAIIFTLRKNLSKNDKDQWNWSEDYV